MSNSVSAGEFESLFSKLLEEKLHSESIFDLQLVNDCFELAGNALGLPPTKADSLHIESVYEALHGKIHEIKKLRPVELQKLIFDIVYMH